MGVLDVVLEAAVEAVIQEAVVERKVRLSGFFPLQIRVGIRDRSHTRYWLIAESVARATAGGQQNQRLVRGHAGIPLPAPSRAQPQLGEWSGREKPLLTEPPGPGNPREHRPFVALSKRRVSVTTQGVGHEILFGETAGHASKEGHEAGVTLVRVGRLDGVAAAEAVEGECIGQIVARLDSELVQRRFAELIAPDDLEVSAGRERGMESAKSLDRLHRVVAVSAECLPIEGGSRRTRPREIKVAVACAAIHSDRDARSEIREQIVVGGETPGLSPVAAGERGMEAPPPAVFAQASQQALARSRTRRI